MFLRFKKRKSKSGKIRTYAYLVTTKYSKEGPRQRARKYLGRVYTYEQAKPLKAVLHGDFTQVIKQLVIQELKARNFQHQEDHFLNQEGLIVNLEKISVRNQIGNEVCIACNQGAICSYTLKRILNMTKEGKTRIQFGKELAKFLLEAGLTVSCDEFVDLFNQIAEGPTMPNNDQQ